MKARLDFAQIAPTAYEALMSIENCVRSLGLEQSLIDLVKLRASQLNGCAYCIDRHWKDARAAGESEQRLYGLDAWRDAPYFSVHERAALEWTEAVTRVGDTHVPDPAFDFARQHFSAKELVDLTYVLVAINGWNRLAISFRTEAGTYQSSRQETVTG